MSKRKGFGELLNGSPIKYVVHCPKNDDYLAQTTGNLSGWSKHPGKAKQFKVFEKACTEAKALAIEKEREFWVCSVQDTGQQLQVERRRLVTPELSHWSEVLPEG
jgi:hypothetical protein